MFAGNQGDALRNNAGRVELLVIFLGSTRVLSSSVTNMSCSRHMQARFARSTARES
jgi:hypothetical protein